MAWACDAMRRGLCRRAIEMDVQRRGKRGRPTRRRLDRVRGDIKERWRKCSTELHGYRQTSTPHKSGNKMMMKRRKRKIGPDWE